MFIIVFLLKGAITDSSSANQSPYLATQELSMVLKQCSSSQDNVSTVLHLAPCKVKSMATFFHFSSRCSICFSLSISTVTTLVLALVNLSTSFYVTGVSLLPGLCISGLFDWPCSRDSPPNLSLYQIMSLFTNSQGISEELKQVKWQYKGKVKW